MFLSGYIGECFFMFSIGKGWIICFYFMLGDIIIFYVFIYFGGDECLEFFFVVNGKYVWLIYESYDIFVVDFEGNIKQQFMDYFGYDVEVILSLDGFKIVFIFICLGDLEFWIINIDGFELIQVIDELGYDGGVFFFLDGIKFIFWAFCLKMEEEQAIYKVLLV